MANSIKLAPSIKKDKQNKLKRCVSNLDFRRCCLMLVHWTTAMNWTQTNKQRSHFSELLKTSKTKYGLQRSLWSVFWKTSIFPYIFCNFDTDELKKMTCMKKSRFSKNWPQTSLRSRFSVLFLWTSKLLFSKRKHQIYELRKK